MSQFNIELYDAQGNMNDVGDILDTIAGKWTNLKEVEQNALATAIAGTRQRENFIVLMENYGKAADYAKTALNSAGTAESKFGAFTEGIEAKMNALTAAIEKFSLEFLNSDLVIGIIETLTDAVEFFTDKMWILEAVLRAVFVVLMYQVGTRIMTVSKNIVTFGGKLNKSTLSIKAWGNAWKTAMMSNPIGWIMGIATAIEMLLELLDLLPKGTDKIDNATEEIENINQELQETRQKMEEAKRTAQQSAQALEDNLKKIEELQSKGSLTYVEELELEKLKEATAELERQKELTQKKENAATVDYYNKLETSAAELEDAYDKLKDMIDEGVGTVVDAGSMSSSAVAGGLAAFGAANVYNPAGWIALGGSAIFAGLAVEQQLEAEKEAKAEYEKTIEGLEETIKDTIENNPIALLKLENEVLEAIVPDKKELKSKLMEALGSAEEQYYEMAKLSPAVIKDVFGSEKEWVKALDNMAEIIYNKYGTIGKAQQKEFAANFALTGFPQFEETKKQLQELAEQGKLTREQLTNVTGWQEYSTALTMFGLDTDTILRIFNERFFETKDATTQVRISLEALKDELQSIKDAYETLNSAVNEYNSTGSISYDTWEKLINLEDKYLSALVDEEGQIKANDKALQDLMASKIEDATLTRMETYVNNLLAAAQNGTLKQTLLITEGLESETNARLQNIMAIIASNSELMQNREQILKTLSAMAQLTDTISLGSDSTKDAKDATEDWEKVLDYANTILDEQIEKLEKEQEALEKLTEEKIKAHEAEIKRLEEEKEALEEKNEEKNKELELEELERNLQKAKQRTMRVYYADKGWVWEQDPEALQEAQQELDDFYTEQKIDNIDKQIEAEEEKIEELEDGLDKELKAYEARIKAIKDYKDQWNKVPEDYKKAQNEIAAKAQLGADAEKKILVGIDGKGGRLKALEDFKIGYTAALGEVASQTEASAKRVNTALGSFNFEEMFKKIDSVLKMMNIPFAEAEGTINALGISLSEETKKMFGEIFVKDETYEREIINVDHMGGIVTGASGEEFIRTNINEWVKKSDAKHLGGSKFVIHQGTTTYSTPYASGTLSAKAGLANVDEKGNELIVPKQGRYRMMEYGDAVVPHNLSQRLFDVASNPLRFIVNALNSVKTPNLMSNSSRISNASTINIGTIELPSVTNGESFIKQLQLIAANR